MCSKQQTAMIPGRGDFKRLVSRGLKVEIFDLECFRCVEPIVVKGDTTKKTKSKVNMLG